MGGKFKKTTHLQGEVNFGSQELENSSKNSQKKNVNPCHNLYNQTHVISRRNWKEKQKNKPTFKERTETAARAGRKAVKTVPKICNFMP